MRLYRRNDRPIGWALIVAVVLVNVVGVLSLEASLSDRVLKRMEKRELNVSTSQQTGLIPTRLRIPSIEVDAPIVQVGLRADGLMDIPPTAHEIGWFSLGFLPGTAGNAVMAGHLDRESGQPAVFWELRKLKTGDIVEVMQADGTMLRFAVTHRATYPADDAPLADMFGSSTGSHLNLITCNGAWREEIQTYDRRLVVYTSLIE